MAKGYGSEKIKAKLIGVLKDSSTGLTGVELAEKIGINRITLAKYLKVLAAEGIIRQKKTGSLNLWFVEEGIDLLQFPDDYFKVKNNLTRFVTEGMLRESINLIRNSLHSGAEPKKIISEVIYPTIKSIQNNYHEGRIGKSEKKYFEGIVSTTQQTIGLSEVAPNPKKNVVILSADSENNIMSQVASVAFHSEGWKVSLLGDMSFAMDVLFDLDFHKFINKVWTKRQGILIVVVFSSSENGIKFFSNVVNSTKSKVGRPSTFFLVICSGVKVGNTKYDFYSDDLEQIFQWCQGKYESAVESK